MKDRLINTVVLAASALAAMFFWEWIHSQEWKEAFEHSYFIIMGIFFGVFAPAISVRISYKR